MRVRLLRYRAGRDWWLAHKARYCRTVGDTKTNAGADYDEGMRAGRKGNSEAYEQSGWES